MEKTEQLRALLESLPGAVVAFSGGVDSTFLAFMAAEVLGERALAVTAVSATYPERQREEAVAAAAELGIAHRIIETNEFEDEHFVANPSDRCYYCKSELYGVLGKTAQEKGGWIVLDGANKDDEADHRPGHRAATEMGVRSPLREVGLTKAEIRELSKEYQLPTWDKPAFACLASRIPYGQTITQENLKRVDQGEEFLRTLGFHEFRLRDHYPVARIEVGAAEMDKAWEERTSIAKRLHELGYSFVSLDLDGFRSGSMNEMLDLKK